MLKPILQCVCVTVCTKTLVFSLCNIFMGSPGGLNGKESTRHARDLGLIPIHIYVHIYQISVSKVTTHIYVCEC